MPSSHRTQLVLTALSACLVTSALFAAYSVYVRRERRRSLNDEALRLAESGAEDISDAEVPAAEPPLPEEPFGPAEELSVYSEDLIKEQLARNYAFFGEDGMAAVRTASVVIVGCGSVGSWAAVMLVRSSVFVLSHPTVDLIAALQRCLENTSRRL